MSAQSVQPHEVHLLDGREQSAWFALATEDQILAALQHKARYLTALLDEASLENESFNQQILSTQGIS